MPLFPGYLRYISYTLLLAVSLASCSKKDENSPASAADFKSYSVVSGDNATINEVNKSINVRVPDATSSGSNLTATFSLSPGASASSKGNPQQSGVTKNSFESDLVYNVTSGDQKTLTNWTVSVSNNDHTLGYGMGHFINQSASLNQAYSWYIDQSTSGQFAPVNCGPASVTMAIKWSDEQFSRTAEQARGTYQTAGGWWTTNDINAYLNDYNTPHGIVSLSSIADSAAAMLIRQLDHGQIVILCLDMDYVRPSQKTSYRVDKFYPTTPQWGHFIVLKGYQIVDHDVYFEAYDPFSFGLQNDDGTLKGMNRYYHYQDLQQATQNWWPFAFVIAEKGHTISTEASSRSMIPSRLPVASSGPRVF